MLEYLNKYAKKAYNEIVQITEKPGFLFSNDPELVALEGRNNYRYIHGFTRLLKHKRIMIDDVTRSLNWIESKIEQYLSKHYKNKQFVFIIYGDIGIPGFTLTVMSYYSENNYEVSLELGTLVHWFNENALFNGLEIREDCTEVESNEEELIFMKHYIKIIET